MSCAPVRAAETNLIPHSEYFGSGSGWGLLNNATLGNSVLSPEGKMNATELIFDGTTSGRLERFINGLTSGANYSVSLYARVASGTQNVFFGSFESAVFTLTTEWQRLERTQPENDTTAYPRIACDDAATIEIYGFQHEAGSYATSYIPTYGTSVTRNADSCTKTGISSLIGQQEGTLFMEFNSPISAPPSNQFLSFTDGTNTNRILFGPSAAGDNIRAVVIFSGVSNGGNNYSVTDITANNKIALKYSSSSVDVFINGVKQTSQSGGVFNNSLSVITNVSGANSLYVNIKQKLVFPTALTDQEAIDLTTI